MSRITNAKRNIISGTLYKIVELGTPFVVRTILLYYLGVEYLGLGSLFTSILQVLNLTELGFSRAIIFGLFKPLATNDTKMVNALLHFYRKVYKIVGIVVLFGGIVSLPFLPKLIKGDYPSDINLYILFLIYLCNTCLGYWLFAYKNALIIASQRQDIISNISTVLGIIKFVIQLLILIVFKNYYVFIALNILFTIANNVLICKICEEKFPQYICAGRLDENTKNNLIRQIKGIAIGKFSQTARNSFDSIILSMFCGLIELAVYSNYFYILTSVTGVLGIIIEAISSGVGDSVATESKEKNYMDFKKFNFYYAWISSWFTICLLCLYQPFMIIWVGEKLCAPMFSAILFSIYFYILHMGQIRAVYASAAGIWWEFRWLAIGETICNVVLNFILGYKFGMNGILWATIITVFVFSIIGISIITFRKYFNVSSKDYFVSELVYLIITVISGAITFFSTTCVKNDGIMGLIIKAAICCVLPNIILVIFCKLSKTYSRYFFDMRKFIKIFFRG